MNEMGVLRRNFFAHRTSHTIPITDHVLRFRFYFRIGDSFDFIIRLCYVLSFWSVSIFNSWLNL